jgi:hypothetical protein
MTEADKTIYASQVMTEHELATLGGSAVLFGGRAENGASNETWLWNGTSWTQSSAPSSPSPRRSTAMARLGNKIVLFGGYADPSTQTTNDTWEWDGARWSLRTPTVKPPKRHEHVMATLGNKVILFSGGGNSSGGTAAPG